MSLRLCSLSVCPFLSFSPPSLSLWLVICLYICLSDSLSLSGWAHCLSVCFLLFILSLSQAGLTVCLSVPVFSFSLSLSGWAHCLFVCFCLFTLSLSLRLGSPSVCLFLSFHPPTLSHAGFTVCLSVSVFSSSLSVSQAGLTVCLSVSVFSSSLSLSLSLSLSGWAHNLFVSFCLFILSLSLSLSKAGSLSVCLFLSFHPLSLYPSG